MKTLIAFTTVLYFFFQSFGYGQDQQIEAPANKQDDNLIAQSGKTEIDTEVFTDFIGKYFLEEADFELEIIMKNNTMYIRSPFSTDTLIQKNETTLREPKRGVDLERIPNDTSGLKFTQNGYETILKRVETQKEN